MTRTLLVTAWMILLPVAASLQAQSLAGVAKKGEEESAKTRQEQSADDKRKSDKPPTKVYTNKDLVDVPPAAAASSRSETGTASSSSKTTSVEPTTTTKDESWWRSRAVTLRRTLADDQTKLASAKAHYDALPNQAQGPLGAPVVEAWMKAKEEITRLTAIVVNDQRALADFEEEARRAGVLPGWIRER